MRILALLLALVAHPALADVCDDLWFTRNLVMDRAGYCFGSALGKAVYDNADCTGKQVTLGRADRQLVDTIREQETALGCRVDTGRRSLGLQDIAVRRRLVDLPVAEEYESGCIGWQEVTTPLFAGRDASGPIVGRVEPGDSLLYSHRSHEGWDYVIVTAPDTFTYKSAGWLEFRTSPESCRGWAG